MPSVPDQDLAAGPRGVATQMLLIAAALLLAGASAMLWMHFGPVVFLNAMNAVWSCF